MTAQQLDLFPHEIPESLRCEAQIGDRIRFTVHGTRYEATAGLPGKDGHVPLYHVHEERPAMEEAAA